MSGQGPGKLLPVQEFILVCPLKNSALDRVRALVRDQEVEITELEDAELAGRRAKGETLLVKKGLQGVEGQVLAGESWFSKLLESFGVSMARLLFTACNLIIF